LLRSQQAHFCGSPHGWIQIQILNAIRKEQISLAHLALGLGDGMGVLQGCRQDGSIHPLQNRGHDAPILSARQMAIDGIHELGQ
jgi:hypothetical protein